MLIFSSEGSTIEFVVLFSCGVPVDVSAKRNVFFSIVPIVTNLKTTWFMDASFSSIYNFRDFGLQKISVSTFFFLYNKFHFYLEFIRNFLFFLLILITIYLNY